MYLTALRYSPLPLSPSREYTQCRRRSPLRKKAVVCRFGNAANSRSSTIPVRCYLHGGCVYPALQGFTHLTRRLFRSTAPVAPYGTQTAKKHRRRLDLRCGVMLFCRYPNRIRRRDYSAAKETAIGSQSAICQPDASDLTLRVMEAPSPRVTPLVMVHTRLPLSSATAFVVV